MVLMKLSSLDVTFGNVSVSFLLKKVCTGLAMSEVLRRTDDQAVGEASVCYQHPLFESPKLE